MVHDYPPLTGGGLALAVQELAHLLAPRFRFVVLTSRLVDHFADDRRRVVAGGASSDAPAIELATRRSALHRLRRADALVVHWTFSFRWLSTLALLLGPMLRKPTIVVVHTAPDHCRYNWARRLPPPARRGLLLLARAMLRRSTATIALGPAHAEALAAARIGTDHVLPLPVQPTEGYRDSYRRRARSSPLETVGIVGELSRLKGADEIPRLLQSLTPELAFRIVGRGPEAAAIARTVSRLPPAQRARVVMSDPIEPVKMASFYAEVDCLLVLSRSESQCRVALEAMLAGVLVVARPTAGTRDLVIDGETGFLVDPPDPELIRSRLSRMRADPPETAEIRRQALLIAEAAFAQSRARWEELLSTLLE